MRSRSVLGSLAGVVLCGFLCGVSPAAEPAPDDRDRSRDDAPLTLETVTPPPPISADEPRAEFSLRRAARYLDRAALDWQKRRKCGTCHTNFAWLVARPASASVLPPAVEVRPFFEDMVKVRWEEKGPRWDAEVVVAATALAWNDRETTGTLHPLTRRALDRMIALQRDDGGWDWLKCGWPPMESDDHYGVTFAALGIGAAPGGFAATSEAKRCLDGVRRYLRDHPPPSLHHRAMVLWASRYVDGLATGEERRQTLERLFALQRPDGGWPIAALLAGWKEHERKDDEAQDLETSDGYGTGFVVWIAREAGVPADDARLRRGVRWLRKNQRRSGRWFTRSPTKESRHFITNAGTAFAVMALAACGEGGR